MIRRVVDRIAARGRRRGAHRRYRRRGPVAPALVMVLALSYAVMTTASAPMAAAFVEPPPGGLVASTPNFGWTLGEFSVSGDGAAQYSLPLWVPQGRGRSTPSLALLYNSRGGNGPLGVGWSLSGLPSITPCMRTHAQHGHTERLLFDGSGTWCLGGNRLIPLTSAQPEREFRTEREMFARIVGYGMQDGVPDYFRVWGKDGLILTLGQTANSRLQAYRLEDRGGRMQPESTTRVTISWAINRFEDRNGNAATVDYVRGEGDEDGLWWADMRPSMIRYSPNRRVEFTWANNRPDPLDGFAAGVHTRNQHRLASIAMFGGPEGGAAVKLREYRLGYENTSVTGRSLLTEIKECDGQGVCKLPLPLEYSPGSAAFHTTEPLDITDVGTSATSGNRVFAIDIDGDGRDDLLYPDAGNNWKIRRSTGTRFGAATAAGIPRIAADRQAQIRPVDFDLDGRTDVMAEVPDSSHGDSGWKLYRSNGSSFTGYPDNIGFFGTADDEPDPVYFGDLDGNGTPDFLTAYYEKIDSDDRNITGSWRYRLNRGTEAGGRFAPEVDTETTLQEAPATPERNVIADLDGDGRAELVGRVYDPGGPNGVNTRSLGLGADGAVELTDANVRNPFSSGERSNMGDFNGDGLLDGLVIEQRAGTDPPRWEIWAKVNTGNGAGSSDRLDVSRPAPNSVRIVDFNRDGRDDVVTVSNAGTWQAFVWQDNGFVRATFGSGSDPGDNSDNGYAAVQPLDIDGNGAPDMVGVKDGHLLIHRRQGGVPDRLTAVGLSGLFFTGPLVEVEYASLANPDVHTPGACTYPLHCLVRGESVVSQHRVATHVGIDDWDTFDHAYRAARVDLHGRGWLGFAEHTVRRALTGEATVAEFDNVHRDPSLRVYPFAHVANRSTYTVTDRPQGREFRSTVTHNNDVLRPLGSGTYTVERRSSTQADQERPVGSTSWQTLRTGTTTIAYDAFGNPDLVQSTTTGGRRVTEDPVFRNDTTNWLIGLPTRQAVTACTATNACATRTTTVVYDDRGNTTVSVIEPDQPALKLTTRTTYGQFGVVESVTRTDNAGQARGQTFEYGNADMLHPTGVRNALGHRTQFETHSGLGVVFRTVDPNGVPATMRYDGFGRPRETNRADGSFERITHAIAPSPAVTVIDSGGGSSTTVLDQHGREREVRAKAFDGREATTQTQYDRLGRVSRSSRPALPGETAQYATFEYDNRGRLVRQVAPDGAVVRHEYAGRETHTYDARGTESYVVETVDGEVASSFEDDPNSTAWLATRFEYGPFGEITRITAPDGTAQSMRYDILGRRERLVDPSSGTTETRYSAFGEVISETDGSQRTATYATDLLGRVRTVTSPDGVAVNNWDTATNGIGKLANARSADGVAIRHLYDPLSRPRTTIYAIEGTQYEFGHGYDGIGRLASTTYPEVPGAASAGRLTVNYAYNQHGYLFQIKDAVANGVAYWTAEARNGAGQLTRERYGNGVVTTRGYSAATGLLAQITAVGPDTVGTIQSQSVTRDVNRNVVGRTDPVNGRTETYSYDTLDRLTSWSLQTTDPPATTNTTYTYDKVGNLKAETVSGHPERNATYTYGQNGAPPHALTSRNSQSYTYDGAGRQLTGLRRTIEYNRAGLPRAIDWGQGQHTEFAYGPDGARAHKRTGQNTVVYAGGLFESRSPAGTDSTEIHNLHNITVEGRVVAQVNRVQAAAGGPITATRVSYLSTDQQGSTVKVTSPAGRPIGGDGDFLGELFYDPFGRRTDGEGTPLGHQGRGGPRQGYTGHYHDDEYGLVNMRGRWYDPEARRFLTPDPFVANPLSGQGHNRYAYVQNNPVTLTDPTGFFITMESWDIRGGAGPSGAGSWWSGNTSLLGPNPLLPPMPFAAPLTTYAPDMTSVLSLGGGPADDDDSRNGGGGHEPATDEPAEPMGHALTVDEGEIIGGTYFYRVGNQYWYWLPGESSPRQSVDQLQWDHQKGHARQNINLDASARKDVTRFAVPVMLVSSGAQVAIVSGAAVIGGARFAWSRLTGWLFGGGATAAAAAPAVDRLATGPNQSVFWSGIRGGAKAATAWVARHGGATMETTMAARGITLPAWDAGNPATVAAWRAASAEFAAGAQGVVRVLQESAVRAQSVWATVEFPALIRNPNVTSIVSVDIRTGAQVLLWARP